MKSMFFLFILGFFLSCAKPIDDIFNVNDTFVSQRTHPDFQYYSSLFNFYFDTKTKVAIVYGEDEKGIAGACYSWSDGNRLIKINKYYWDGYNETQREVLIFHELGHCHYGLGHIDKHSFFDSCPISIMRSYMFDPYEARACYEVDRPYYIEEILGRVRK